MLPRRESSRAKFVGYRKRRKEVGYQAPPVAAAVGSSAGSKADAAKAGKPKKKLNRPFLSLFTELWRLIYGHRRFVGFSLATMTVVTIVGLSVPASTKLAIDYIMTDSPGPSGIPQGVRETLRLPDTREGLLWYLGGAMVALSLLGVLLATAGRWQLTRVTKRVQVHLRRLAFEHAAKLPIHRVQHYKSGGMASLLRDDAGAAGELLFNLIYNPWKAIVQLTGTLLILAWVDWRMLAGALMLIPVVWLTHKTYIARIRPLYSDAKAVRQTVDSSTTEAFAGVRVVRGFARERSEAGRFTTGQHYMARIEILTWWWSRLIESAWAVLIPAASAAVLIYGGTRVVRGELTIGDVMMFSTYMLMLLGPLESLTSSAANLQNNLAALDRVLDLLDEPVEHDADAGVWLDRDSVRGRITIENVSFAYPKAPKRSLTEGEDNAEKPADNAGKPEAAPTFVLQDVSLDVKPGQTVALVGPSGSGKTTLCNLIARFYDPTHGRVLVDGVELREVNIHSYRSLLGIVEQDVFLFDGSIAANIAYGRRDATEADIIDAARAANAHEFIIAQDKGYETLIGERGVRLSGGQKQRIAIARAILADPRILILDEATSNLDSESEALIQRSLSTLVKGRTCFVIAHRLSTVRHADRIVVMEKGRIIETGTHEELLALSGRYADLLRLQVQGSEKPGAKTVV